MQADKTTAPDLSENVHEGHRERMKQQFLRTEFDHMEPHEVLEMVLYSTISRTDTNPVAHRLIDRFGSLAGVFDAPYERLLEVDGVGEKTALMLRMLPAAARAYLTDRDSLEGSADMSRLGEYLLSRFAGRQTEMMVVICLDNRRRIIADEVVSEGSVNSTPVCLRRLLEIVLGAETAAVVLSHNHPRGLAVPSQEDLFSTHEIERLLNQIGITLLDHIIVAERDYISLAQSRLLARQKFRTESDPAVGGKESQRGPMPAGRGKSVGKV